MQRFISKALGFAGYVAQYACLTHCTFEYIGDFVVCNGPSMEPTLYTDNILITERITARMNKVQRGDIVIARCPTDPKNQVCKRVIGLPGDRIIVKSVAPLPVNTRDLHEGLSLRPAPSFDETVASQTSGESASMQLTRKEIVVPRGHVWIEGDNAANSADSRYYGPVPLGLVNSRAVCRVWPLNDMKLFV